LRCRNFWISRSPICLSFLLIPELLEFYLESYCPGLQKHAILCREHC
jgi:hypothetical protein